MRKIPLVILAFIIPGIADLGNKAGRLLGTTVLAALGLLSSILGFGEGATALMIGLYLAQDSFGTACNVTGDGAIAMFIDGIRDKSAASPEKM